MLLSNAMVWRYFVKGLHSSDTSTLIPTVISTASNFLISGILAALIFQESTNFFWLVGILMIITGLYCIILEDEKADKKD
jgi:drug/metabolite transporter (DMT)-like permease